MMEIQVVSYDSYQSEPTPLDRTFVSFNGIETSHQKIQIVPIIRLYAIVENAPVMVHVHNVFPYLYVPLPNAKLWSMDEMKKELNSWFLEINNQIAISFKSKRKHVKKPKRSKKETTGDDSDIENDVDDSSSDLDDMDFDNDFESNQKNFVADLSVIAGTSIYGYHIGQSTFLKISLSSPKYISRLNRLLLESKVFNKFIQPYEFHIPYLLQFLSDYNIYTLKTVNVSNHFWRSPIVQLSSTQNDTYFSTNLDYFNKLKLTDELHKLINKHIYTVKSSVNVLKSKCFPRMSKSFLELDILSPWIDNRYQLSERHVDQINDYHSSPDTTYITSTKSLLDDVNQLRGSRGLSGFSSQMGLYDNITRSKTPLVWSDNDDLTKLLKKSIQASESSYVNKFKEYDVSNVPKLIHIPKNVKTAFQNIDVLQYRIELDDKYLMSKKFLNCSDYFTSLKTLQLKETYTSEHYAPLINDNLLNKRPIIPVDYEASESDSDDFEDQNADNSPVINHTKSLTEKLNASMTDESADHSISVNNSRLLNSFKNNISNTTISFTRRKASSSDKIKLISYFSTDNKVNNESIFVFNLQQPLANSKDDFLNSLSSDFSMSKIEYPDPFYSRLSNFDSKPFIFAGEKFTFKCTETDLPLYPSVKQYNLLNKDQTDSYIWKYTPTAPSYKDVHDWCKNEFKSKINSKPNISFFRSQTKGPTQKFKEFKYPSLQTPIEKTSENLNPLSLLIIEIHVNTRGELLPDPEFDDIQAIFWSFKSKFVNNEHLPSTGVLVNSKDKLKYMSLANQSSISVTCYDSELDLIIALVSLVEYIDPDILSGWELHNSSWGYIIERASIKHQMNLLLKLSRVFSKQNNKMGDRYGYTHASSIKITGRQMLNIWRRLRSELNLNHYSLENVVFHIFHERLPFFESTKLTNMWNGNRRNTFYLLNYYIKRVNYEMDLIMKLEVIEKINEQSRLLGIDFYSIIYRGSQFKVESLLVRLAKAENLMLISPSKKQVFKQDSLECIPLVMEPNSAFYKSPLVVLDFQSLYPSLIMAYNICYSTLLGRLKNYNPNQYTKMGVTTYKATEGILKYLENDITITPNGMIFAKENIRKSLLSKMLLEILNTRIYVKNTMNYFKDDLELRKLYNNRQLALKLIANVTYGYTSATYSGRMPNSDIADAIVSCARETLLNAVKVIEANPTWDATVVYGDTDSLFVYLPGKTKDDAFRLGREIADHITSLNPSPVKLKFEKVYLPSVLISKKRYVGWSFEYESQLEPKFDAKGIETVRRDGIPAQQKILEKSLTILFGTRDMSVLKDYLIAEFVKIIDNKVNIKDFMFAKEVRVGTYKNEKYIPAGARLAMKRTVDDHRVTPQYKERIFYLVRQPINSKEILRDKCVSPSEFIKKDMRLDSDYYINKVIIPPLERIFNLIGIDVRSWVREIPQRRKLTNTNIKLSNLRVDICVCCGESAVDGKLCANCKKNELKVILTIKNRVQRWENTTSSYYSFCENCVQVAVGEMVSNEMAECCSNEDCNVFYSRVRSVKKTNIAIEELQSVIDW